MSQPTIKNGKVPLSRKQSMAPINSEDIFDNALGIDPALEALIKQKGFAIRYINSTRYSDMGGSHPARWVPVSMKKLREWGYDTMSVLDFGSDPDGYIRRAELVLAIRPIELNDKHKAYLKQEADRARVKNLAKSHADKARSEYGGRGIQVHEGYQHDYIDEPGASDDE